MTALERTLQCHDVGSESEAKERIFESLCGLVDSVGAEQVYESLQRLASAPPKEPWIPLASAALQRACLRSEGAAFGQLYDAHLRLTPIVIRGESPKEFPMELDRVTCLRLHDVLRQMVVARIPGAYPLPLSFSYTMEEFANESITHVHEILRSSFKGVVGHSMETAPRYIAIRPSVSPEERVDSDLYDLRPRAIGSRGWADSSGSVPSGDRPIARLAEGDWITFRVVPVVFLVPYGGPPPMIDGFGEWSDRMGAVFGFSSQPSGVATASGALAPGVCITAAGLYGVTDAPSVARLMISRARIVNDVVQVVTSPDPHKVVVDLSYYPSQSSLQVAVQDEGSSETCHVRLPNGYSAYQFIEQLEADFRAMGFRTKMNHGDSMIHPGPMDSLSLH